MTSPYVFVKDGVTDRAFSIDLADQLSVGETIATSALVSISPTTVPALAVPTISHTLYTLDGLLSAGLENTTYGARVQLTTSLARVFTVTVVAQVVFDMNVSYATKNPVAFQSMVGELAAGEAAVGKAVFALPAGFDASGGLVSWCILDTAGRVHAEGNTFSYSVTSTSFITMVEAEGLVNLPTSTPPTLNGQGYQLRWSLLIGDTAPQHVFESLRVPEPQPVPLGAVDAVEMEGDPASLSVTLARLYDMVGFEIYLGNIRVVPLTTVGSPKRTSSGWCYVSSIDTTGMPANLIPYSVSWRYSNFSAPGQVFRETAKLFVLSGSLLTAIDDCRTQVMKARTTTLGMPDAIFDIGTIISWLRRGRDQFNAAGGVFTHFTMSNATGGIREFWLKYSEIAMLRAQALAEGEKAFDFQGQAISLNVDKAQYYSGLADALQSTLDNDVRPLKMALKTSGIAGGDGDLDGTRSWNVPKIGIAITPASHLARAPGYRVW